jgi:hypothetical protein
LALANNPDGRQKRFVMWTAAVLVSGLLAGCAQSDTGLQPATARQLQARVLEVSEASSRNDPATAMTALEGLEAELAAAQSRGQISEERRQTVTTIAAAVRADLEQALTAAAKAAEEAKIAADQAAAETPAPSTGTPAPAPEPAPLPAPAPAPETGNDHDKKDNEGKGKGKD